MMMNALNLVRSDEKIRVILIGHGVLAAHLVRGLLDSADVATIVGIMPASNLKKYAFLKDHYAEKDFLELVREQRLNILETNSVNSNGFVQAIKELKPHVLLVGGWVEIIKPVVLSIENLAIINCHGSMLPKYRGACPCQAAIFNGDKTTGLTYHLVDEGIDTGDILLQQAIEIGQDESAVQLSDRIAHTFGKTVAHFFQDLKSQKLNPSPQMGPASYVPALKPEWGWIPWSSSPKFIDQQFRALSNYVHLVTSLNSIAIGFENGQVVVAENAESIDSRPVARRFQLPTIAGVVVAVENECVVVSTNDPKIHVKLNLPFVVFPNQAVAKIPDLKIGDQFLSLECQNVLRSA